MILCEYNKKMILFPLSNHFLCVIIRNFVNPFYNTNYMIPYSFLDLAIVSEGSSISQTLENSVKIAQTAEKSGYTRYWFAEHHNMKSVASSATSVLIGHIAGKTSTIRVG